MVQISSFKIIIKMISYFYVTNDDRKKLQTIGKGTLSVLVSGEYQENIAYHFPFFLLRKHKHVGLRMRRYLQSFCRSKPIFYKGSHMLVLLHSKA
jgi:hypothetical protein